MAIAGISFFEEPASLPRIVGIILALTGLFFLRS
jgi:multidrug transporter EmrE-like cation transporter